jgi:NADPH:quinone reductase
VAAQQHPEPVRAALRPFGTLVALGNVSRDADAMVASQPLWLGNRTLIGFNLGLWSQSRPGTVQNSLRQTIALLAEGEIAPPRPHIFRLQDVSHAHAGYESGQSRHIVLVL